jgi:predicted lipoprotein with Yx(FWY)xxD motif
MRVRAGVVAVGVVSAALLAGSGWGGSAAFAAPQQAAKHAVVFRAGHVAGVKGQVLLEGPGLVVYTFTGDKRGKAGTCTGACATIWPPVRGVPEVARGVKLPGKFGRIKGQVTYNGWPLYGFTGEKKASNHANSEFKVVHPSSGSTPAPHPSPTPTNTYTYMY